MRLVGSFGRVKTGRPEKKKENRKQSGRGFRFFYCIPIGTVAYRYGYPIGGTGGNDGRKGGRLARTAGLDGAESAASPGAAARMRNRAPHRADERRLAGGELRDALPRSAEAGARGLHFLRVGHLRQQPQGQVLQTDARRAQATGERSARVGADYGNSGALPGSREGLCMRQLRVLLLRLAGLFRKTRP